MYEPTFCPTCSESLGREELEGYQRPVCPACGFVYYHDPKVAVAVLVPSEAGIVLGRRAINPGRGRWSFPSGYVNRGEVLEEAAIREVREEVGLDVRIRGLVGVYSTADEPVVLVVYAAEVVGGTLSAGTEMTEVTVVPPRGLPEMAFSHDRQIIEDFERFLRVQELLARSGS
ncbi:MAG: NUDIX hydrolase [Chloroflexi bacterium]|nr:NUDIX hydrolase [Chloroflexota bacterium]